MVGIEPGNFEY